jgi:hypothetical protein
MQVGKIPNAIVGEEIILVFFTPKNFFTYAKSHLIRHLKIARA